MAFVDGSVDEGSPKQEGYKLDSHKIDIPLGKKIVGIYGSYNDESY